MIVRVAFSIRFFSILSNKHIYVYHFADKPLSLKRWFVLVFFVWTTLFNFIMCIFLAINFLYKLPVEVQVLYLMA
jgi:hypothetical protein